MKYALRKLDTNKYSILNLSENKVIGTFRENTQIRFDKNRKHEYITLYHFIGKEEKVLYVIPISDLIRIERVKNNTIESRELTDSKNKLLSISNFFKESYDLNYIKSKNISSNIQETSRVRAFNSDNKNEERVYIPGHLKIDNNSEVYENINLTNDMVLIKTEDSVKTLSFYDLVDVLTNVGNKKKTIWDLGVTPNIDESTFGTNPTWQ